MNIEIYGAKFVNKGAELMLNAIVKKIKEKYPEANFVLSCSSLKEFKQLENKGFLKRLAYRRNEIDLGDLGKYLPSYFRRQHGIVTFKEVDVVFDASGFAYGDQWTYRLAMFNAKNFRKWKKYGTKLVIMPQAFGPFQKSLNGDFTRKFIDDADLVYVRDRMSLGFVRELNPENITIKQKPDFTILLEPLYKTKYISYKDHVCLIPNNKVIATSSSDEVESQYLNFFFSIIKFFENKNCPVFILNHEGRKDYELALKIKAQYPKIPIISEEDPMVIKGIIGNSKLVIGSRFHGLVSSLSQGVPSLAIGWSHKYEMLFEDFGFKEGVLDISLTEEEIRDHLDLLFNLETREEVRIKITKKGEFLKDEVKEMWSEIYSLIKNE